MRVDWCVSSWFRIKNTHSLTHPPLPFVTPFSLPLEHHAERISLSAVRLSLFEVKSRIRAPSALSLVFLPGPPIRDRSGTHAGEASSSCCTAPASPSQA